MGATGGVMVSKLDEKTFTGDFESHYHIIFTNPSARAGYDTRSIFMRSLTRLNSEFSFI